MPHLWMHGRNLPSQPEPLAVSEQAFQAAVLPEDRDDLRRLTTGPGQVDNGDVSSCEVGRALHITQKTAWFMDHRIRFSLGMGPGNKLSGQVEADETFIGGKARNMHASKRARVITGTGGKDEAAVLGILERGNKTVGGKIRTKVVGNTRKRSE